MCGWKAEGSLSGYHAYIPLHIHTHTYLLLPRVQHDGEGERGGGARVHGVAVREGVVRCSVSFVSGFLMNGEGIERSEIRREKTIPVKDFIWGVHVPWGPTNLTHTCGTIHTRNLPKQIRVKTRREGLEEIHRLDLHHPPAAAVAPSPSCLEEGAEHGRVVPHACHDVRPALPAHGRGQGGQCP